MCRSNVMQRGWSEHEREVQGSNLQEHVTGNGLQMELMEDDAFTD